MKVYFLFCLISIIQISHQVGNKEGRSLRSSQDHELVTPIMLKSSIQGFGGQAFVAPQVQGNPILMNPPMSIIQESSSCGCQSLVPTSCLPCSNSPSPQVFAAVMNMLECQCAVKPKCSPCPALYTAVHEMALKQAFMDINNQAHLQEESIDQAKFYQVAQKAAEDMKREEERAYDAAKAMEEATAKAEMYRQKMLMAAMHARHIAAQTLSIGGSIPNVISVQSPDLHMHIHGMQKPNIVKTIIREQDFSEMRN